MTTGPSCDSDHAKCEDLLRRAARTSDMAERGRLIDEAAWWRFRASETAQDAASAGLASEEDLFPLASRGA